MSRVPKSNSKTKTIITSTAASAASASATAASVTATVKAILNQRAELNGLTKSKTKTRTIAETVKHRVTPIELVRKNSKTIRNIAMATKLKSNKTLKIPKNTPATATPTTTNIKKKRWNPSTNVNSKSIGWSKMKPNAINYNIKSNATTTTKDILANNSVTRNQKRIYNMESPVRLKSEFRKNYKCIDDLRNDLLNAFIRSRNVNETEQSKYETLIELKNLNYRRPSSTTLSSVDESDEVNSDYILNRNNSNHRISKDSNESQKKLKTSLLYNELITQQNKQIVAYNKKKLPHNKQKYWR